MIKSKTMATTLFFIISLQGRSQKDKIILQDMTFQITLK